MEMTNTEDRTAEHVATLNDLLQLDYDAVSAYQVALRELNSPVLMDELEQHLNDHQRHIEELERHITQLDGMKMPMPHATGAFKLAVQGAVALADDRKVLLAFKANEKQVRDKYARVADEDLPVDIRDTIRRAAADERRHYDWAVRSLEQMGASRDDMDVRATRAFAGVHGRTADMIESVERRAMQLTERSRRVIKKNPVGTLVTASLAVVGVGVLLREISNRR